MKNKVCSTVSRHLKNLPSAIGVFLFWIAVWYTSALIAGYPLILPYPHDVAKAFVIIVSSRDSIINALFSILRVIIGFVFGVITGVALAFLTEKNLVAKKILSPALSVIKTTPVASFVMLAWVFVGNEKLPILVSLMMVLPIVWQNVSAAIAALDKNLSEVTRVFDIGFVRKMRIFVIPSLLPFFIPSLIISMGLAWKAGIAAEVISHCKNSIGNGIYESKVYLETSTLFAWTILVILLSIIIENIIAFLGRRLMKYERIQHTS